MNEYDSSKMADLLDATHGYQLTDVAEEADVLLLNTCSIREKAQEKSFPSVGPLEAVKEKSQSHHRCRWLCRISGRRSYSPARPLRRYYFGPQTLHRLPEMINKVRGSTSRSPVVDISFPEIEKFDRLPEPRAEGPRVCVHHGRL